MKRLLMMAACVVLAPCHAAGPLRADQQKFLDLYKDLVQTDTSITTGNCTALATKVEARLKSAGFTSAQITRFAVPDHPKEGGVVAVLPGTSKTLKPILLLGHIDVVTANRADWTRNPYQFIEDNGYFWGRGVADMKGLAAIWIDMLARFKSERAPLKRTLKLALTCGEETSTAFNGAQWLAANRRELIDAEFALNEGGGGRTDGKGKLVVASLHVGEKTMVNYRIEATNEGGHSSAPVRDNAIYELSDALVKLRDLEFPLQLNDTTRQFFLRTGKARGDDLGNAMMALAQNPNDKAAEAKVNTDKSYHSMLRTTCVATLLDGGHANNALPQRAGANINCRLFPGDSPEAVRATLQKTIADPRMTVKMDMEKGVVLAVPPPLDPKITAPAEQLVQKYHPGVPLVPTMGTGATDGRFLEAVGIPSYGPPGLWSDPDGNGAHGLNERMAVDAVFSGRELLTELVKIYANQE
jgi:acetylornithine deacetylase/succinyl-diaminopimelate desuccinylase-like protein